MNTEMNTVTVKRGRKEIFEKRDLLVKALRSIQSGETETRKLPSRFLQKRLEAAGLVEFTPVHTGTRGRPAMTVSLTPHGARKLAWL